MCWFCIDCGAKGHCTDPECEGAEADQCDDCYRQELDDKSGEVEASQQEGSKP